MYISGVRPKGMAVRERERERDMHMCDQREWQSEGPSVNGNQRGDQWDYLYISVRMACQRGEA